MKRYFLHSVVILLIGCSVLGISSCRKTSTTPPVIILTGPSKDTVSLNSNFTDPGATATDVEDGSDVVTSDFGPTNPNLNLIGTYTIHYSAYDNAGNKATKNRTVVVINDAQGVGGTYAVNDVIGVGSKNAGTYSYTVTASVSPTTNNELFLTDFSGLGGDVTVTAIIAGTTISLFPSPQSPSGMKDSGAIANANGGGLTSGKITSFNYTITYSSSGSDHGTSTWVKQ